MPGALNIELRHHVEKKLKDLPIPSQVDVLQELLTDVMLMLEDIHDASVEQKEG